MSKNDDKLDFYKSELGVSTGALPDLEYRWLRSKVGGYDSNIPDMWAEYFRTQGYSGPISDSIHKLPYPLGMAEVVVGDFSLRFDTDTNSQFLTLRSIGIA